VGDICCIAEASIRHFLIEVISLYHYNIINLLLLYGLVYNETKVPRS